MHDRRVAYFAHAGEIGGPNNSLAALLQGLDRDRFTPFVYFPAEGPAVEAFAKAGESCRVVPARRIEPSRGLRLGPVYARELFTATAALRKSLRNDGVDLVHINTSVTPHPGLAARSIGLPIVWHVREVVRRTRLHEWYVGGMLRLATRVVAVSTAVRERLLAQNPARAARTVVIANGIDLGRFDASIDRAATRDVIGVPAGRRTIVLPGSILPHHKGHEVMIEAASLLVRQFGLTDFSIVFLGEEAIENGDRPVTRELQRVSAERGLTGHIVFAGFRRDVATLLTQSDIVCLPSICEDALPRGVLEAMAAGRPVVGSDIGGIPEMVVHQQTGLLVAPGRADALAAALAELIADEHKATAFGRAGRARVEQAFTSEMHARRVEALYQDILEAC